MYLLKLMLVFLVMFCAASVHAAEPVRVAIFSGTRARADEEIKKTLEDNGMVADIFGTRGADYSEFHNYDVIFFGGGHSTYDWLTLDARMHLIELVEQRGGGAVFSIFRCGTVARSMIRPLFPEVADAYNKVNSRGITVIEPEHPVMEGIPENFLLPYWDHAVMRLGPQGRALAVNSGGETAIACGETGDGRVVFLGPWVGINIRGRNAYPMEGYDEQLLVNSIRWAAGSQHRDKSDFKEISEETQFKVLRRERTFDWTHDDRGMSWNPGLLTQARDRREQELYDLSFRLDRLDKATSLDPKTALEAMTLKRELGRLAAELTANHRQSVRLKQLEISRMTLEELRPVPFRSRGSDPEKDALIEEWKNRLLLGHQVQGVADRVIKLENRMTPFLERIKAEKAAATAREDERNIRSLIDQLSSSNPDARAAAALELGRTGDSGRRTEQALISLLSDNDYNARRNAIYALSWIQSQRAVPELIKILEAGDDTLTRRRAAQALGQIGSERAVEPLLKALGDQDYHVRQNAILSLGWIGDKRAVEPLMEIVSAGMTPEHAELLTGRSVYHNRLFRDKNGWDSADLTCAIRALGHIGDKRAIELLSKAQEKFAEESIGGFLPCIGVAAAARNAIASIENGGRPEKGVAQLEIMRDPDHFYWMTGRYNALFGRYTSWRAEPADADVMLAYAAGAGGTGIMNFRTPDAVEARHPDIVIQDHLEYASELDLKIVFEMRQRGLRFDKAGMEYDIFLVGHHPSFGGFWGEESLHFDETSRAYPEITENNFRAFVEKRYSPEQLKQMGVEDINEMGLPEPDAVYGTRPAYLRSGARANQKVLFAEYMEFVADQGVEEWEEACEWLKGFRKGLKMSFSLSDRYVHGGSTYISAYARVNRALDAAGPQSYGEHSTMNNFNLDLHVDGESRPAQGEFYAHQADTPGRVERGFASSFVYGQQFFNWWWGHIFKHAPDVNSGSLVFDPGRWEAAVRQFTKGKAISEYLAPGRTRGADLVTQLYSGRTTTLSYGDGYTDSFGLRGGETVTPTGYPIRYTQNQIAQRESIVRSHLPIEMTWLETQSPEKLARWNVAILTDALTLCDSEVEMLREWVRNGGTLIATASSTLHDRWDRKQENYSLADVFGINYVRTGGTPGLEYVERDMKPEEGIYEIRITAPEFLGLMEGAVSAEYEKAIGYDVIEPVTATVVGVWADDETPAIVENRFGDGHAIFIAASYPALSHQTRDWTVNNLYKVFWPGMRELLAACVRRGLELTGTDLPLTVENCPETVDVVLKRQEQNNRWMAHLLNMDEKNGLIQDVRMTVNPPHPATAVYYTYPERTELEFENTDNGIEFMVRPFDVHEMVVIEWEDQ